MLQAYSLSLTLADGQVIPLNSTVIEKGCTAVLESPATIELNRAGVYVVACNADLTGTAAGEGTIQLSKNGVAMPFAKASATLAVDEIDNLAFETLIQVPYNNTKCCYTSPTTVQLTYTGADATGDINVVVTKLC